MIQITDNEGRMLPAIRNLFTLAFCIVFFFLGWFGHANWSLRGEADQLIEDAKVSGEIREDLKLKEDTLDENIEEAVNIEQTDCNCGDATDIDFMRKLREDRTEGFKFDGTNPFPIYSD